MSPHQNEPGVVPVVVRVCYTVLINSAYPL